MISVYTAHLFRNPPTDAERVGLNLIRAFIPTSFAEFRASQTDRPKSQELGTKQHEVCS